MFHGHLDHFPKPPFGGCEVVAIFLIVFGAHTIIVINCQVKISIVILSSFDANTLLVDEFDRNCVGMNSDEFFGRSNRALKLH